MTLDLDAIKARLEGVTEGPWTVFEYDAGDCWYYDQNGPCPSIQAPDKCDCAIVHWGGFKQEYWSSANGDQKQIEANARFIAAARTDIPALVAEVEKMRDALESIASQKKTDELETEYDVELDFEGGYDACIDRARATLKGDDDD